MKIEVLGVGCAKCNKTFSNAEQAIKQLNVDIELVKVEKIDEIMKYGVMITPALVINGDVRVTGKIPSIDEIKRLIEKAK